MTGTQQNTPAPTDLGDDSRVIVRASGSEAGPSFLAVGSLHGNEPSGLAAIRRVSALVRAMVDAGEHPIRRGDFLGLAGNLEALKTQRRFIDYDLNRGWSTDRLALLEKQGPNHIEDEQMLDLFTLIQGFKSSARGALSFLDLHSTSGNSPPFASVANLGPDRELVAAIPVPTVLGIDRHLEGTFLECMQHFDFSGIVFEGGQHDDPLAIDHNEAALWLVLERLGMVDHEGHEELTDRLVWAHDVLEPIGASLPSILRIKFRYALESTVDFSMCPGFESFQAIEEGQLLARHRDQEVRSDRNGRILMPLYQPQGDEGFFLMEES